MTVIISVLDTGKVNSLSQALAILREGKKTVFHRGRILLELLEYKILLEKVNSTRKQKKNYGMQRETNLQVYLLNM